MQKILKRLELIKTAIALEDEAIIELQIMKLTQLDIDDEVKKILNSLDESDYVSAEMEIQNYITKYNGIVIYEDKETQGLRLELKALEKKLQSLNESKTEYLNDIEEFNILYHLRLGNIIQKILELRQELLQKEFDKKQADFNKEKKKYQKIKKEQVKIKEQKENLEEKLSKTDEFDDTYDELYEELQQVKEELEEKKEALNEQRKKAKKAKEAFEEDPVSEQYEEAKNDYEEFSYEYNETKEEDKDRFVLSNEEKIELKSIFRQASRLCHPDIVTEELKAQAHEVMSELNDAYDKKDIKRVNEILQDLLNGTKFEVLSESINDNEVLKAKIVEFKNKIDEIQNELDVIKEDELLKIIAEVDDIDTYLDGLKEELDQEYESLKNALLTAEETENTDESQSLTTHQSEVFSEIVSDIQHLLSTDNVSHEDIMMILSGSAGVGKTFMTAKIIHEVLNFSNDITITAPTHKAVAVVNRMIINNQINNPFVKIQTLHSFLKVKLKTNYKTGIREFVIDENDNEACVTDVLIVDESSMIGEDLFSYIEEAVYDERIKTVLFVGDLYQLPPVNSKNSTVFNLPKHYELTEIVRQSENSYIINIASKIRDCIKNKYFSHKIESFFIDEYVGLKKFYNKDDFLTAFFSNEEEDWSSKNQIIADYTNKSVNDYNSIVRQKYWSEKGVNLPEQLRVGDTVVFQEANMDNDKIIHTNSSMATVRKSFKKFDEEYGIWYWHCVDEDNLSFKVIDEESISIFETILNQKVKEVENEKVGLKKRDKWIAFYALKDKYVSVKYIYSSTVHKLQGSTYDTVFIDLRHLIYLYNTGNEDREFLYRLLYVAVTRASEDICVLV